MHKQLRGVIAADAIIVASHPPCHEVHLAMVRRSSLVNIVIVMSLPHHLVVRVDEVSAPVVPSARVELWPVRYPALSVVDGHLVLLEITSRYDDSILHLDTAGEPDDEMIS